MPFQVIENEFFDWMIDIYDSDTLRQIEQKIGCVVVAWKSVSDFSHEKRMKYAYVIWECTDCQVGYDFIVYDTFEDKKDIESHGPFTNKHELMKNLSECERELCSLIS